MARRYSRDNSGRFASAGAGATARGGRLRTAAGNKRATVTAKVSGGNPGGTMKGKIKRDPGAMSKVGQNKAAAPKAPSNKIAAAPKPAARTSKAPANIAKIRYKRAAGQVRNPDLRGASASGRRAANTAAAKVRLMERNRSTALPKAAPDSPRSRQQSRQIGRTKRAQANQAQANQAQAMKNESAGPNSKMSRKASVAKRAQQIYSGKINPKEKTLARLTKTNNPEALRKRVAKIKDNTKKKR